MICLGISVARGSAPKQDTNDKRLLCHFANKGKCREKSNECKYRHQRCEHFEACFNSNCLLAHANKEISTDLSPASSTINRGPYSQNQQRFSSSRYRSDSCSSESSIISVNSTRSMNTKRKPCCSGVKCFNIDCDFDHPDGWNPCANQEKCEDYECTANHPFKRKDKCRDGKQCKFGNCKFLHPDTRTEECSLRAKCHNWNCSKLHPRSRARPCPDKQNCTNLTCLCLHPPERDRLICSIGADCCDISCKLNHPPERQPTCNQPDLCSNFNCTYLHNSDWNPCEAGDNCKDAQCPKIHSSERYKNSKTKERFRKSLQQRMIDWKKAKLPILSCRDEFCQRLAHEHVLVVIAETGSGKSTQLPQYAAEHFGSLVVCTQPRVVAAISLARRVAGEYDGTSVGESVGYKTGNGNRVVGSSIMFMTDAALIRDSQRDPTLAHIRVLIIDEAHERSLNTDIVLGIAKLLLAQRPKDFYVVIASATIDPTRFLHFFNRSTRALLEVEGRVFPVTTTNKPPPADCSDQRLIETHVVPSVIDLYPQHQGHILVFLPGQGEIERALRIFKSKPLGNCIALPLYGSQSPEDQEKVIKFNEKNRRMVVFCTNVAETSLTIPDVRLVIDSGWGERSSI